MRLKERTPEPLRLAKPTGLRFKRDVDRALIGDGELKIVYRDVRELKDDPRNTRTHGKAQIEQVKGSLLEMGWTNPFLLHKKDVIIAGHGRKQAFLALKKEGKDIAFTQGYKVPCIYREDLTEAQRRAYVIADNRLAELAGWDMDMLKDELNQLKALEGFDVQLTGFDLDPFDPTALKDGSDEITSEIAWHLEKDVIFPTDYGEMDFPKFKPDMILDLSKVKSIATWGGRGSESRGSDHWFYNFNSDSQVDLDWKRTLLGFYVDDHRFECWWEDTPKYCQWAGRAGLWGVVTPNYSTYYGWPRVMRLWNVYRSRHVGRYLQEVGIKIIPDIAGAPDDIELVCEGLKGFVSRTISIQCQQTIDEDTMKEKRAVIDYAMDQLDPDTVLFYAPSDRLRWFPSLKKSRVILIEPRTQVRSRRVKAKLEARE